MSSVTSPRRTPSDPGTDRRRREVATALLFLVTVGLLAWTAPSTWLSGVVAGLGIGALAAAIVYLRSRDDQPPTSPQPPEDDPRP